MKLNAGSSNFAPTKQEALNAPFHPISGDRFDNSNAIAKAIGWALSWLEILLQNFLIP